MQVLLKIRDALMIGRDLVLRTSYSTTVRIVGEVGSDSRKDYCNFIEFQIR